MNPIQEDIDQISLLLILPRGMRPHALLPPHPETEWLWGGDVTCSCLRNVIYMVY